MFDLFRSRDKAGPIHAVALACRWWSPFRWSPPDSLSYGSGDRGPDTAIAQDRQGQPSPSVTPKSPFRTFCAPWSIPAAEFGVSFYVPQIVDQLVTERILAYEAGRLGFKVSEDDTFNAIHLAHPPTVPRRQVRRAATAAAAGLAAQQNMTIDEYERQHGARGAHQSAFASGGGRGHGGDVLRRSNRNSAAATKKSTSRMSSSRPKS